MKDKEMIEEMAKDMYNDVSNIFEEEYEKRKLITPSFCANKLLEKGYRKLPKDSVVLSREERQARDYECYNLGYEVGKKEGSKETAEKILNEVAITIKTQSVNDYNFDDKVIEEPILLEKLKEIATREDVEIKE